MLLACWPLVSAAPVAAASAAPYAPALTGRVVKFDLSGFEPDFDPIYSIVMSDTLHDTRPAGVALPDTMLVLDVYLEQFHSDTTPILPDLLHPDQVAKPLVGFMQGKAVLVNAAGHIVYQGGMQAEIFATNAVHVVLFVRRVGANPLAPVLQLRGTFTLFKGGTQQGLLRATKPDPFTALAVRPSGHAVSWQSVVGGLSVKFPKMVGKAGNHHPYGTATPPAALSTPVPGGQPGAPARGGGGGGLPIDGRTLIALLVMAVIVVFLPWETWTRRLRQARAARRE